MSNTKQAHPNQVTLQIQADFLSAAYYGGITYWAQAVFLAPGQTEPTLEDKKARLPEDSLEEVFSSDFVALGKTVMVLVIEFQGEDLSGLSVVTEGLSEDQLEMARVHDGVWLSMDSSSLSRGIRKAAAHRGFTVARLYEEHDAGDADLAVQFALFGRPVFG